MATERSFGIALAGGFRRELAAALRNLDGLAHACSLSEGGRR
jgi:hypothetical protein